ncbi:MAG: RNA polymerase subunit sigma [Planctomycetaceae bacterium]|nr:RNA polymerase subunit sigma [Planctomycetaceae bacterium]
MCSDPSFAQVYNELRTIAAFQLANERRDHTLSPTALVNEAYLRMQTSNTWIMEEDGAKSRFLAAAGEAMRRILVDYARKRRAVKRGGGKFPIQLPEDLADKQQQTDLVLSIDEALCRMRHEWPDLVTLVELRFFLGLKMTEVAQTLGIPLRTAERNWQFAKAWLRTEISK